MTAELAARKTDDNSPIPFEALVKKYHTQTKAAKTWGVSQSAVSLLLNGQRGSGESDALRTIAKAEGISTERIILPAPRRLQVAEGADDSLERFVYDIDDPHRMLKQVQHWFSDLPSETRMKRQVVRAVMRTLFDESFDAVHPPSRHWRTVMHNAEGLHEPANATSSTRAKGPR